MTGYHEWPAGGEEFVSEQTERSGGEASLPSALHSESCFVAGHLSMTVIGTFRLKPK
jgi:hypothetical protein